MVGDIFIKGYPVLTVVFLTVERRHSPSHCSPLSVSAYSRDNPQGSEKCSTSVSNKQSWRDTVQYRSATQEEYSKTNIRLVKIMVN